MPTTWLNCIFQEEETAGTGVLLLKIWLLEEDIGSVVTRHEALWSLDVVVSDAQSMKETTS